MNGGQLVNQGMQSGKEEVKIAMKRMKKGSSGKTKDDKQIV